MYTRFKTKAHRSTTTKNGPCNPSILRQKMPSPREVLLHFTGRKYGAQWLRPNFSLFYREIMEIIELSIALCSENVRNMERKLLFFLDEQKARDFPDFPSSLSLSLYLPSNFFTQKPTRTFILCLLLCYSGIQGEIIKQCPLKKLCDCRAEKFCWIPSTSVVYELGQQFWVNCCPSSFAKQIVI